MFNVYTSVPRFLSRLRGGELNTDMICICLAFLSRLRGGER